MASTYLSDRARANLYTGLYRLCDAGMAGDTMLKAAAAGEVDPLRATLLRTASTVGRGQSLANAGLRSGLWARCDVSLVRSGEESGHVPQVLRRLADHYRRRGSRSNRMRAKLIYPLMILVIGIFAAPVPRLFSGELGAGGYMARTLVPIIAALGVYWVVRTLRRQTQVAGYSSWFGNFLLLIPLLGSLIRRKSRTEALERLSLYISCGSPARPALSEAVAYEPISQLRATFNDSVAALERGLPVADALREGKLLNAIDGYALLSAAEAAGKFDVTLARVVERETQDLEDNLDLIGTWIPRLLYVVVIGVVGGSMVF